MNLPVCGTVPQSMVLCHSRLNGLMVWSNGNQFQLETQKRTLLEEFWVSHIVTGKAGEGGEPVWRLSLQA